MTQLLQSLAVTVPVDESDVDRNDATLRRIVPTLPGNLTGVSLWGPGGANIGSSEDQPASGRLSAADRPFFLAAMRNRGIDIEAPLRLQ